MMIKWICTSKLSTKNYFSTRQVECLVMDQTVYRAAVKQDLTGACHVQGYLAHNSLPPLALYIRPRAGTLRWSHGGGIFL